MSCIHLALTGRFRLTRCSPVWSVSVACKLSPVEEMSSTSLIGLGAADVYARSHVETKLGQRGGHGARIGGGLLQHGHAAIGVVADDERDALIGKSGRGDHEAHHKRPETKHARAFTAKRDEAQATATGGKRG